jgi:hypothetical protein
MFQSYFDKYMTTCENILYEPKQLYHIFSFILKIAYSLYHYSLLLKKLKEPKRYKGGI